MPGSNLPIVANHVYVVVDVNAAGVTLYNPHGKIDASNLTATMPWDQIKAFVGDIYVQ